MKKAAVLLIALVVFCCKKKDKTEDPPAVTTTTTTTTGSTTAGTTTGGQTPKYAAEFEAYNSLDNVMNTANGSVKIYNKSGDIISLDYVKINGKQMGQTFSNEYRSLATYTLFAAPVSWEISSLYGDFPDTTFMSRTFPVLGFTTAVNTVYDKTQDFTVNIDVNNCDSMLFELGGVTKRLAGRSGINTVTFNSSDNVKRSTSDTNEVEVVVQSYNYDIFTVRGRKWKSTTGAGVSSHYKFKN